MKKTEETEGVVSNFVFPKRQLSPQGIEILDQCQAQLWMVRSELNGLSGLLRNMSGCDFSSGEFMGLGLSIERFSKRLKRISDKLSLTITGNDS